MNIEESVIKYLDETLSVPVCADVPKDRPKYFVTVERTGGQLSYLVIDTATIAVQSWAPTRLEAAELSHLVDSAMVRMHERVDGVISSKRDTTYNWPDPDGVSARYQGVYDITFYNNVNQ